MLQGKVLVFKLGTVDGFATSSVMVGKIATLAHEVWNDTMECRSFVAKAFFASAQRTEVLSSFWDNVGTQLKIK